MTPLSCVLYTWGTSDLAASSPGPGCTSQCSSTRLVQGWPPLRTALQLREGAEGWVVAGTSDQRYSHVSLHVNKWFRSGSPSPAKCCAHWGWTKFQSLCWHPVHPFWPAAVSSLSAQSCMPSQSGGNIPGSYLHIKPSFISRATELCGWQPFQLPQPVISSAHTGNDLGVPLPRDGCSLLCNLQAPPWWECITELPRWCLKAGLNLGGQEWAQLGWSGAI